MERPFFFKSSGYQLAAVLHAPSRGEESPCIVMCHGYTGNKVEAHRLFVQAARRFVSDGFAVLRFDFRGSGDSEGGFDEMTVSGELEDFARAPDVVEAESAVDGARIGVLGLSLGGAIVLCGSALDQRPRAVVAWSAPARLTGFRDFLGNLPLVRLRPGVEGYDQGDGFYVGKAFLEDAPRHSPVDEVAKIAPRPVLLVHGTEDKTVPFESVKLLYDAAREPKRLAAIEGGDHVFTKWHHMSQVFDETSLFFQRSLRTTRVKRTPSR